jgi:hypothetical protein
LELGKSGSKGTISSLIVVALPLAPGSKVFWMKLIYGLLDSVTLKEGSSYSF